MTMRFFKYHGAGNDFILIDNREKNISLSEENIKLMCERRFGIGADGLMLLEKDPDLDFRMVYYNSDGKEGSMCGNGGRCIMAFAIKLGIVTTKAKFSAIDGVHEAYLLKSNSIRLKMNDVNDIHYENGHYFLNTGSPHHIRFVDESHKINVVEEGRRIRNHSRYSPDGTNVNFVEISSGKLFVRTYERGVEDETLACGTGITAAAICASMEAKTDKNSFEVKAPGGLLQVDFKKHSDTNFTDVWLTGPAEFVFSGEYTIN